MDLLKIFGIGKRVKNKNEVTQKRNNILEQKELEKCIQDVPVLPKCNCNGCHKQDSCKYGHLIYDEFDNSKLNLSDKFIMNFSIEESNMHKIVWANKDTVGQNNKHNNRQLARENKIKLLNTLECLEEEKKWYLNVGKCGQQYFKFINGDGVITQLKDVIKKHDDYSSLEEKNCTNQTVFDCNLVRERICIAKRHL